MEPLPSRARIRAAAERESLFGWTVFLLLLTGLAIASWIGSFQVFGHPEQPLSYRILTAVGKIDPPKRFELTRAPNGEFLSARGIVERYGPLSNLKLAEASASLERAYIRNYALQKDLVPYLVGRFTILEARELTTEDFFPSGVVALARSATAPGLLIEYVCTAPPETSQPLLETLQPGMELRLERSIDLSVLTSISRLSDGRLLATVVPLLYGSYAHPAGDGHFTLEPPALLNPAFPLPVTRPTYLAEVEQREAERQRIIETSPAKPPAPALARVMRASAANTPAPPARSAPRAPKPTPSTATATPAPSPARALPSPNPSPRVAAPSSSPTPPPTAPRAIPVTPATVAAPTTPSIPPLPESTPATPLQAPSEDLKPFLAAEPVPSPTAPPSSAPWRTYPPGQMPRGRLVSAREAASLGRRAESAERSYLEGEFEVVESSGSRAVLQPRRSLVGNVPGLKRVLSQPVRVIVQFPPGTTPPAAGNTLARDAQRPFQILGVETDADGRVVIRAREITAP